MDNNPKIDDILNAAEEVMSVNGSERSSIAEIARKAGVTDSQIYSFFSGKEDLLFSIMHRRMKEVHRNLAEQIEGILDPLSRLGKMIWFYLNFNNTHTDYARLLLLECRSNPNFYQHAAYALIKNFSRIMTGVLEDGIATGAFRSDINIRLVRDMIFGLLDWETLNMIASKELENSTSDFQDILALVLPMITPPKRPAEAKPDKRSTIMKAAEQIFAERGYAQATIRDIAKTAGVSEGTIYEYFKNKEDLLLSIPERRFNEHLEAMDEIFEIKTPLRRLVRFIHYHFLLYVSDRNFLKVFLLHIQLNDKFYQSPVYRTFQFYTRIIDDILEEGKRQGDILATVNNRIFKNLFFGAFNHMGIRWFIVRDDETTDKMVEIDEVVRLLCRAVAPE